MKLYDNPSATLAAGGTGGVLAYTGLNSLWWALAAFALVAAGTALMRIVPRSQG